MRVLHTADWHIGKKLGRIDRASEFEAAIDEITAIAKDQKVDLAIVAGDLLDRALPSLDSISLVVDALIRLADASGRVVAMPGNHDSPQLFEVLARLLEPRGVMLVPRIARPENGGLLTVPSRDGSHSASVGVFPFLHEAQVVDFMAESEEWFKGYAQRIRLISAALCDAFDPKSVGFLVGHYFVDGAEVGGGERQIHLGQQYAATAHAIPPGAAYVALGHIHRPQEIAGAAVRARYSGSILQLDFSERTHKKEVVIVEAVPGKPAQVKSIQLSAGRRLVRVEDELEELRRRADEFGDAYLDVRVKTSGPVLGLADEVRAFLPNALAVQAVYERSLQPMRAATDSEQTITEMYAEFHHSARGHSVPAPMELIDVLKTLEEEVLHEAS